MPVYVLVACRTCKKAKIAEKGAKSTTCASCGKRLDLRQLRILFESESIDETREAAGRANARLAGREGSYPVTEETKPRIVPSPPSPAAAGRRVPAAARAETVARALGEFSPAELVAALAMAGAPAPEKEAQRFLGSILVTEVAPNRWRVV
ncbi:MAG: DUF5817 domain-containing protein [Thermoplasmatota archaeon]